MDSHIENLTYRGYTLIPDVIKGKTLSAMQKDFEKQIVAYEKEFDTARINENETGTIRCIVSRSRAYDPLFHIEPVAQVAEKLLGKFIHYSFNGFYTSSAFVHPTTLFHRDVPVWTNMVSLSINCLYLLDDVNGKNGATWLVPCSHLFPARPSDSFISENKVQISGKAGSVLMFQSNLYHASGENRTSSHRKCIANVLRRNFMQPQFNWSQVLSGEQVKKLSDKEKELLGFLSLPAGSIDDYYREGIRRRDERKARGVKTQLGIEIKS
jgi:ectoine hydroxylase-related dioxygenase (phytanoyl-CoA dioxygenase family)